MLLLALFIKMGLFLDCLVLNQYRQFLKINV